MPPALEARPVLDHEEILYWDIYQELHNGRGTNGFGHAALAFRDIIEMANIYGLDTAEQRLDLLRVIRAMDREFFLLASDKVKEQADGGIKT